MNASQSSRVALSLLVGVVTFAAAALADQAPGTSARAGYDVDYLGPPLTDPMMQQAKETYVSFGCAYCHGVTLTPRGEAADLMRSPLVGADTNGDAIAALLRAGVPKTSKLSPMPQFSDLSDRQLHDIARYIHYARQQGRYKELVEAKGETGDGVAGKAYFDQNCAACHAADLNGIGRRYDAIALRERLLRPRSLNESASFAVSALSDDKVTTARQRHNFLLENYTLAQVTNLVAYLQSQ
ncbi:MAG TPA: c-type cytochrome [Vicinamibacterales bacterium]|nr:c-type cytochrome [Vicinamibacterales bacterium]